MLARFRLPAAFVGLVTFFALVVSCSSLQDATPPTINVLAAASLSVAGDELAEAYAHSRAGGAADGGGDSADVGAEAGGTAAGAGTDSADAAPRIEWNFAGSSALVRQIEQGAPADVFISADEATMDKALELPEFEGAQPTTIATNELVLAIAEGNPANIHSLADLGGAGPADSSGAKSGASANRVAHHAERANRAAPRIAMCAPEVPCGTLAHNILATHHITPTNPSEEANVSDVATKVATGQVDAGFVYNSDVQSMKNNGVKVTVVRPGGVLKNKYPAAPTKDADGAAADFVAWLGGEEAQQILRKHGFSGADE